jgi:hypothetical protein
VPYSLQPALSPGAADFDTANNGTEYLRQPRRLVGADQHGVAESQDAGGQAHARGRHSVWVANEWIPGLVQGPDLANWSTYITKVTP